MKYYLLMLLMITVFSSCEKKKTDDQAETPEAEQVAGDVDQSSLLTGAWTTSYTNEKGEEVEIMTIVEDGYLAETFYSLERREFVRTFGGTWLSKGNVFSITTEFDTNDSTSVGQTRVLTFDLKGDTILFEGDDKVWTKVDSNEPGALVGAWFFSGRERDGEMTRREFGARRTLKILSGTRFQWVAYNVETAKFSGTGGGTYTTVDGKYTENIEFFSKDSSRVGASLTFDYELKDGEWHHKGLSSKGDPIHEIWAKRK
ncbi:membrane or secreted protein [Flammeovirgaceae bacterium SG7u.111]|nr:membrane or secreted protein [Flammeovirgaceae bacterium SG7u.132]WPO38519.1 membrane or secreted protein [Flammeovirgaceae bacterium SG7u.111]